MDLKEFEERLAQINERMGDEPSDVALIMERGRLYHKAGVNDKALNDFLKVSQLDPSNEEAREYVKLLKEIFAFRYMDYYNP